MGWKNVKEHYRIGHIVQVDGDGSICIGSPYIRDLIVIGPDGSIVKKDDSANEDLRRYRREMQKDPDKLRELVQSPDTFERSITVYTYDGGDIIEKQCEDLGWPNVTHDGQLIFDNTFSVDRAKVIEWAKRNALASRQIAEGRIVEAKRQLAQCEQWLAEANADIAKLEQA